MATPPIITLLTDFGLTDHYVAAMKGVILGICPDARLVDISHEIAAFDIEQGAFTLAQAWTCFPRGTVHLAVVDPGVGSGRRPLVLEAGEHRFVAPDNGVLTFAMLRDPDHKAHEINAERYFRHPVSRTFHGRDIFAPTAAHLANGLDPAELGTPISHPLKLSSGEPVQTAPDTWQGRIVHIDRFGNLVTNFTWEKLRPIRTGHFEIRVGSITLTVYRESYSGAPAGEFIAIPGSSGFLEVSINQADAARAAGALRGDPVELRLV